MSDLGFINEQTTVAFGSTLAREKINQILSVLHNKFEAPTITAPMTASISPAQGIQNALT